MPNPLTTDELNQAKTLLNSGTTAAEKKSALNSFYQYMSDQGYGYADLAQGLVNGSTMSGNTALDFLQNAANAQGVTLSNQDVQNIEMTFLRI